MRKLIFTFLILLCLVTNAQREEALKLYNEGVGLYNEQNYKEAVERFTASIEFVNDRDTYFSRGLCFGKMADQKGFCSDMAAAAAFGHEKARSLFRKGCGKIDTTFVPLMDAGYRHVTARVITFQGADTSYKFVKRYHGQVLTPAYDSLVRFNKMVTDTAGPSTAAEFPGGLNACYRFIAKNTNHPLGCRERFVSGTVKVQFDVYEDGTLQNISVPESHACADFDIEAMRIVAFMPRWKSAMKGKKLVKSKGNVEITFNVH